MHSFSFLYILSPPFQCRLSFIGPHSLSLYLASQPWPYWSPFIITVPLPFHFSPVVPLSPALTPLLCHFSLSLPSCLLFFMSPALENPPIQLMGVCRSLYRLQQEQDKTTNNNKYLFFFYKQFFSNGFLLLYVISIIHNYSSSTKKNSVHDKNSVVIMSLTEHSKFFSSNSFGL